MACKSIYQDVFFYYYLNSFDERVKESFIDYVKEFDIITGIQAAICLVKLLNQSVDPHTFQIIEFNFSLLVFERRDIQSSYLFMKEYVKILNTFHNRSKISSVLFNRLMDNSFDHERKLKNYNNFFYNDEDLEAKLKLEELFSDKEVFYNYCIHDRYHDVLELILLYQGISKILTKDEDYLICLFFHKNLSFDNAVNIVNCIKSIDLRFRELKVSEVISELFIHRAESVIKHLKHEIEEGIFDPVFSCVEFKTTIEKVIYYRRSIIYNLDQMFFDFPFLDSDLVCH